VFPRGRAHPNMLCFLPRLIFQKNMNTIQKFLVAQSLGPESLDAEAMLRRFDAEMTRGLEGAADALPMIPSYVTIDRPVPTNKPVAVMDAGGTNLRVATVCFDAAGKPHIEDYVRHPMPGTRSAIEPDAFFETLAGMIEPVAKKADSIGFCFSYPAEITPDRDARLLRWTKQIKAPGVVGMMVGAGLRNRLAARGLDRPVTVLNDTVATLLAGKSAGVARRYGSYVGVILGTGTNTAYVERHARIVKCRGLDPSGSMVINIESGCFPGAPRSPVDDRFEATTIDPGSYSFEKMIAGAYLGGLGGTLLQEAARAGCFTPDVARALLKMSLPSTREFDAFCANPFQAAGPFAAVPFSEDDRRTALTLGTVIYVRAARLAAINIAAAAIRTGAGSDPLHPVGITVDGSTYYRTVSAAFASRVQEQLRALLVPRGIYYELLHVDEAPIIGAAVAGLTQ